MTDTSALRAFLEARLAEDERTANEAASGRSWGNLAIGARWKQSGDNWSAGAVEDAESGGTIVHDEGMPTGEQARHIARHDPARVLREVAAKRAILAELDAAFQGRKEHPDDLANAGRLLTMVRVLKLLASVWSDHGQYQQSWAPETVTPAP